MGWGQNPADVAAAERAAVEARERIDNRPLTPGERQIVNTLERIAEGIEAMKPVPIEPVGAITANGAERVAVERGGIVFSGYSAAEASELASRYFSRRGFNVLLDADPRDLSLAIDAGATALGNAIAAATGPLNTHEDYERLAEVVIDAALKQAADMAANGGQAVAADEEVAAGDQAPAATSSTT